MERNIRATKRELAGLDTAVKNADESLKTGLKSDFEDSAVKLKRQEAKLEDMLKQTDRRPDNSRVQTLGFGKSTSGKTVASASKHYKQWIHDIGASDGAPKTLAGYYNLKYNKPKEFELLTGYSKAVQKGHISPFSGFSQYLNISKQIESDLIGVKLTNGITVESYTTHFIDRIIGQTSSPHSNTRTGVPIATVKKCLQTSLDISDPYKRAMSDGSMDLRVTVSNMDCSVAISIRDNKIIQTNPVKGH